MRINNFKQLNEEQIQTIETQLRIKLPEDYRKFLKEVGGGVVEKDASNRIRRDGLGGDIVLDVLYGNDMEHEKASITFWMKRFEGELLEKAVLIGDDLLQGFLVMICDGEDKGIYYWDDSYRFASSCDENNMYWISDSFDGLLRLVAGKKRIDS